MSLWTLVNDVGALLIFLFDSRGFNYIRASTHIIAGKNIPKGLRNSSKLSGSFTMIDSRKAFSDPSPGTANPFALKWKIK